MSARYTFLYTSQGMSGLIDSVNDFCGKYQDYSLFQIVVIRENILYAVLTTD